jgi:hypothetical protein
MAELCDGRDAVWPKTSTENSWTPPVPDRLPNCRSTNANPSTVPEASLPSRTLLPLKFGLALILMSPPVQPFVPAAPPDVL